MHEKGQLLPFVDACGGHHHKANNYRQLTGHIYTINQLQLHAGTRTERHQSV